MAMRGLDSFRENMMPADVFRTARSLGVTAGAVALAVLCWMSASDRMTAQQEHARPTFFGGEAAAQVAFEQLMRNKPKMALAEARYAVRTAPVDPSTTSALGSSLLALGRSDQAYAAFIVAGSLGWRDVPTQLYWLAQAAAVGDADVVSERLDALLRLGIDNPAVANSLYLLGQTPLGQQALASLLLKDPPWERDFLIETGSLEGADLAGRLAAIDLAVSHGATVDCEAVGIAAKLLIRRDQPRTAKQLWRSACDRAGDAFLSNGTFEADHARTSYSPFTWQLRSKGGVEVIIRPAPPPLRGEALRVRSSMTVRTIAASQLTALQPGSYRLSWSTALDNGRPDRSITVLVRCDGAGELTTQDSSAGSAQGLGVTTTFSVPSENCPIQMVAIQKAASSPGGTQSGWIDDVKIVPLASATSG
jgi:hypothetical protein